MYVSLVDELRYGSVIPEIAGTRVMISGVSSHLGVDIARAFADHRAQLLIQVRETSIEMDEVAAMLAQTATDLKVYDGNADDADDAVRFAQGPAQHAFGGLDVVINLIELTRDDLASASQLNDIEDLISKKLLAPTLMSRIVANRMRLTWTNGSVLNVVSAPASICAREKTLASLINATLATITLKEAEHWADKGVRINAVAACRADDTPPGTLPPTPRPAGEPEVAQLALFLASKRGAALSGQVFDAAKVAQ